MKKVKMILSIAAVVFAVAGALATNSVTSSLNPEVAFLNAPLCEVEGTCRVEGDQPCELDGTQVYEIKIATSTTCNTVINGIFE